MFPVIDVSEWEVDSYEPSGRGEHPWLLSPEGTAWLFKPCTVRANRREGEDWAERIAAELASAIGLPAASIEMAVRQSIAGCISRDVKPATGWEMQEGAVALSMPDFVLEAKNHAGHNIARVASALRGIGVPPDYQLPEWMDGYDLFCGFLIFDAWVTNQDRHEQNWSMLRNPEGDWMLAPSYDHGSALAFNLLDTRRRTILGGNPGIEYWANRGRALRFEDGRHTSLVAYALRALREANPHTEPFWKDRINAVDDSTAEAIIAATPEMSDLARTFSLRLLVANRERVLE